MPDQLMHIVSRARDDDRITVRVIPFSKGAHAGLSGPFTLLEFDGGLPDLLYLDAAGKSSAWSAATRRIAEYADSFESLVEMALSAEESLEFIEMRPRKCPESAAGILATLIHLRVASHHGPDK